MKGKLLFGLIICLALGAIIVLFAACGQGARQLPTLSVVTPQQTANEQPAVTWPDGLPEDQLQPWETMDANGYVIPPRRASNLNFDSIFAAGIERYLEAGDVTDFEDTGVVR